MSDPDVALDVHAREELGLSPDSVASPWVASGSSFGAFAVGATAPLVPWFIGGGTAAILASLLIGLVAAALVGVLLAKFTERSPWRTGSRQVAVAAFSCGVTFLLGNVFGSGVG